MILSFILFGFLTIYYWNATDRFQTGMFFTLATYPVFERLVDICLDKWWWPWWARRKQTSK